MLSIYHQKLDDLWCAAVIRDDDKIVATSWSSSEETILKDMLKNVPVDEPFQVSEKPNPLAERVLKTVRLMIEGKDVALDFKYDLSHLPGYSQRVLRFLMEVPMGYVTTYGALAKAAGGGARAVGNVMASNPLAPLIPCHRVVRSNYAIGGYGGEVVGPGISMKLMLLQRENRGYKEPKTIKVDRSFLQLFPANVVRKN